MTQRLRILASISIVWLLLTPAARARDFALLIGGQGAEEPYTTEFVRTLASVRKEMVATHGYAEPNVRFVAENPGGEYPVDTTSTLESVRKEFERLGADSATSDTLLLILLGHGQSDFSEAKFNLPGPDLSAQELRSMLDALPAIDQRLILIFPCSGHFAQILSSPDRATLASCDGPREFYHSAAAPFLLQAFQGPLADTDRNGETSLYEIWEFLSQETANFYQSDKLLPTEHPSLDDNGDRQVSVLKDGQPTRDDGERAKTLRILPAPGAKRERPKTPGKTESPNMR